MILQLRKFNFTLIYKPGKKLIIADTLSRAFVSECFNEDRELEVEAQVCLVSHFLNATDEKVLELVEQTKSDSDLQQLKAYILDGWPRKVGDVSENLKVYFKIRSELSSINNLLYRGQKLIVPSVARQEILSKLHSVSHLGVNKCIERANLSFYWPFMNKQIQDMVLSCATCQIYSKNNQPEPLSPHDVPKVPWHKVACDVFHFDGQSYLLVVD